MKRIHFNGRGDSEEFFDFINYFADKDDVDEIIFKPRGDMVEVTICIIEEEQNKTESEKDTQRRCDFQATNKEELFEAIGCTKERYEEMQYFADIDISAMCSDVLGVLENCIEIPEGATNGHMVKAMFPDARVRNIFPLSNGDEVYYIAIALIDGTNEMRVTKSWWEAPFKTDELVKIENELRYPMLSKK